MYLKSFIAGFAALISMQALAQLSSNIHINQVGYYTTGPKYAAVIGAGAADFNIISSTGQTLFSGKATPGVKWNKSGEIVQTLDFSEFELEGTFTLSVAGVGQSYPFAVNGTVLDAVSKESARYFYYNRCSYELKPQYAGIYARAAGHADTDVLVCDNNFPGGRAVGSRFASPGGWYDAGDYNKYIQTAGISVYTLLSAYEQYPEHVSSLNLNIPESNNTIPDLIDECLYELRWMLTMQDLDGGVYTKLSNQGFGGMTDMPNAHAAMYGQRYVCRKNTPATLQFAASMAAAYRILEPIAELSTLRAEMLDAAKKAWTWSRANTNVTAGQCECNISTGAYGDDNPADELVWAACEMYLATGDITYYNTASPRNSAINVPDWWGNKQVLGVISLLLNKDKLTGAALSDATVLQQKLTATADGLVAEYRGNPYRFMKTNSWDWGSNGDASNQSFVVLSAYSIDAKPQYREAALSNIDYILGRNPSNYCTLTGFGSQKVTYVHHRISYADGIEAPVPGMLVGGPYGSVDGFVTSNFPSPTSEYAMTEVTINWNAPFAFATIGLQALFAVKCPTIDLGQDINLCTTESDQITLNTGLSDVKISWKHDGQTIAGQTGTSLTVPNQQLSTGTYTAEYNEKTCIVSDQINLSSTMPLPDLGPDRPLIDGTLILDAGIVGSKVHYTWYADGQLINTAQGKTLTANKVNTLYRVDVSTDACAAQSGEMRTLPSRMPYNIQPATIPGTIQAAEYDSAYTSGISYSDSSPGNTSGAFRNDDVDIEVSIIGGYNISYTDSGEWTEYTVNVTKSGTYSIGVSVASLSNSGNFSLSINGSALVPTTAVSLAKSSGWQDWKTVTINGIQLKAGEQVVRFNCLTGNFNWKSLSLALMQESVQTQNIVLSQGWNLISFRSLPANKSVMSIFENTDISTVKTETGFYRKGQPAHLNSLDAISLGQAYLVHANSAQTVIVTGPEIYFDTAKLVNSLTQGWNMTGTGDERIDRANFPATIAEIKDFDNFFIPPSNGGITNLEPGKGYFIYVK